MKGKYILEIKTNKSVTDINLAEASIIAGLFQAPGKYNPLANPENVEARRKNHHFY